MRDARVYCVPANAALQQLCAQLSVFAVMSVGSDHDGSATAAHAVAWRGCWFLRLIEQAAC
jgi:hypothetical protein